MQGLASVSAASTLQTSPGPDSGLEPQPTSSLAFNGVGQTGCRHSTENMEKMSLAGHLCFIHWVMPLFFFFFLPQATVPAKKKGGPIPFALYVSLPIRNPFKLISLLILRERVVRVQWKRRKRSVLLCCPGSCTCSLLAAFSLGWSGLLLLRLAR